MSFGDALREVAEMNLIRDDFLVVRGDIITNIVLEDAFKMHYHVKQEEDKKENMNAEGRKNKTIMTKLLIKRPNSSPLKDPSSEITLMMDSTTHEIFKYQSWMVSHKKFNTSVTVNEEFMPFAKSYG